ncbi:DEKNAAC103755 [Brettanomyces naardenensis]|uniref:DEKNAAC103755 n=1 Tax=Brettanomyces naardenensis TaxID=13370 RepID=A0A448YP89_BRENA|nr:DEKNAAC103755 [Brettanomyces naardenensis]
MTKRSAEESGSSKAQKKDEFDAPPATVTTTEDVEMEIEGGMEGLSGDESESEEEIVELDDSEDEEMAAEDGSKEIDPEAAFERSKRRAQKALEAEEREQKSSKGDERQTIYLPHRSRPLGPDEVLEPDPSVYEMLHRVNMPWPCMTLDILPDNLGSERRGYPATMYMATATQASKPRDNEMIVMKLSSLAKTLEKDDDDDDDDEDDEEDDTRGPILENETIPLKSTTNRLRVSPLSQQTGRYLTGSMQENGEVSIFDISSQFKAFDTPGFVIPKQAKRPLHIVKAHGNVEGYGLDWSPVIENGALLSGDVTGRVYLTTGNGSKWVTDKTPFQINDSSIEDIQWSRSERTVFATGSIDGRVSIWDTRSKKHTPAISVEASKSDVNVISWCDKIDYLLASGHDDGSWGIWDLRNFKPSSKPSPVVSYDFHKSPITAISFNPLDESIVAVASEDNTVTLWDLAVEADDEEIQQQKAENDELKDIPAQLLFVHWQKDVKDVRWHRQIPGALVSTGTDGINVWKTISV